MPDGFTSNRLLKKGVQVGNIRFRSLKSWSYWRKLCRSHGTFSPFGFADRPFGVEMFAEQVVWQCRNMDGLWSEAQRISPNTWRLVSSV